MEPIPQFVYGMNPGPLAYKETGLISEPPRILEVCICPQVRVFFVQAAILKGYYTGISQDDKTWSVLGIHAQDRSLSPTLAHKNQTHREILPLSLVDTARFAAASLRGEARR